MDYQIVPKTHKHFMLVISLIVFSLLPYSLCIVNRDLVLTPKQGLQLSGKRIFYEESLKSDSTALNHDSALVDRTTRPWERTLKHVTYLTLFTNAPNGIITGNFSKVKEYNEFLSSAYVRSSKPIDSRFGDIVTLAQGRLETMSNGSYHFVEGNCDYECARESNIVAMWHVQKIRHRDTADGKYHYEMKFSVSPMTTKAPTETIVRGGPNKRTIMEDRQNNVQTFVQKEDDYPNSFQKIVMDKDGDFSRRHYDTARNFRQGSAHYLNSQQVTPIPQSTFLRGVYHNPPPLPTQKQLQHVHLPEQSKMHAYPHLQQLHHHPKQQSPLPERLNIGEFYKGNYVPNSAPKIELFPNLLNMFMGKQQHSLPTSSTFRPPTYQIKFPRPEVYTLQQHHSQEFFKNPEYQQHPHPPPHSQEQFNQVSAAPGPVVTHHYHHHYLMPNNSAVTIEQSFQHSAEHNNEQPVELYHNEVTQVATPQGYVTSLYKEPLSTTTFKQNQFPQPQPHAQYNLNTPPSNFHQKYHHDNYHFQHVVPPAPQKFLFPITQIEQQRVVHVTPTPPLRKPQYAQQHQQYQEQNYESHPFTTSLEYTTVHVPLLISYPATLNEEERADVATPRNKPFVQSHPIEENIQYSEPDPLYVQDHQRENGNANQFRDHQDQQEINQEPQLESPEQYEQPQNSQQQNVEETDSKKEHSESIEAQLPAPNKNVYVTEKTKAVEKITQSKQSIPEQNTSQSTTSNQIVNDKNSEKSIKIEASNSIARATKSPKLFALRNKRISLKTGTTTSSTTTKPTIFTSSDSTKNAITETDKTSTASKPRKAFVSTSSTETPLRTITRYRNSYVRTSSSSTSTTEKPVLKWTPKRKANIAKYFAVKSTTPVNASKQERIIDNYNSNQDEDENADNEDIKTNESNNLGLATVSMQPTTTTTTITEIVPETTTELSNALTTGLGKTISILSSSSPLLTQTSQTETEIYEVLTQKSISKSVSLKVGSNGEEIPVIVDDDENEVKRSENV